MIIAYTLVLYLASIAQVLVGKEASLLAAFWEKNVEVAMEAEKKFARAVEAVPGSPVPFVTAAGRSKARLGVWWQSSGQWDIEMAEKEP